MFAADSRHLVQVMIGFICKIVLLIGCHLFDSAENGCPFARGLGELVFVVDEVDLAAGVELLRVLVAATAERR